MTSRAQVQAEVDSMVRLVYRFTAAAVAKGKSRPVAVDTQDLESYAWRSDVAEMSALYELGPDRFRDRLARAARAGRLCRERRGMTVAWWLPRGRRAVTTLPMVCACGDERRAALDARLPDGATVEHLAMELGGSGHGFKLTIHSDMWFGIEAARGEDGVYVQCDRLIDGFWAILEHVGRHEDSPLGGLTIVLDPPDEDGKAHVVKAPPTKEDRMDALIRLLEEP